MDIDGDEEVYKKTCAKQNHKPSSAFSSTSSLLIQQLILAWCFLLLAFSFQKPGIYYIELISP
jgi:hypothetical protein